MTTADGTGGRHESGTAGPDRAAVVAHELRGPLGVVATVTELLLDHGLSAEDRHLVELVRLAGAQALAIADDLVADAGLGADRFRVVPAPFDPARTLRTVAELWTPLFSGGGARLDHSPTKSKDLVDKRMLQLGESGAISSRPDDPVRSESVLAVDIAPDLPARIVGDESRVRQILFNLVSNAAKASNGGVVTLALTPGPDGGVVFSVSDDGDGLAEGFRPAPFAEATRPVPGTGLGLWISCRIADALSGRLTLRNGADGGAVAELALPAHLPGQAPRKPRTRKARASKPAAELRAAPAAAGRTARPPAPRRSAAPARRPLPSPLAGLGVLVVDDSAVSRLLMQTILDSFEMSVETAAGGDEAVDRAIARRPDLVILDWSLARETGADVLDRLEAAFGSAMPPVISVSADARPMHGPRVAAHVVKPFTPRELHGALERTVLGAAATAAAG